MNEVEVGPLHSFWEHGCVLWKDFFKFSLQWWTGYHCFSLVDTVRCSLYLLYTNLLGVQCLINLFLMHLLWIFQSSNEFFMKRRSYIYGTLIYLLIFSFLINTFDVLFKGFWLLQSHGDFLSSYHLEFCYLLD